MRVGTSAPPPSFPPSCPYTYPRLTPRRKAFATENAYRSHITSKKHRLAEQKWTEAQAGRVRIGKEENVPGEHAQQREMQMREDDVEEEKRDQAEGVTADSAKAEASTPVPEPAAEPMQQDDEAEEEEPTMEESIEAKIARARGRIPPNGCLFCTHTAEDIEANLQHMAVAHSFFLPDTEYLVDVEGLLQYLGEKVAIGNVCLWCPANKVDDEGHPVGNEFSSLEAVRAHMKAKGHCKLAYDTEWERQEVSEYYDFEASYPDAEERRARRAAREERRAARVERRREREERRAKKAEQDAADGWEEVDGDDGMVEDVDEVVEEAESEDESDVSDDTDSGDDSDFEESGAALAPDGLSLRLPSGRTLGHRSLRVYYAQHLRPLDAVNGDDNPSTAITTKLRAVRQRLADPTQALIPVSGGAGGYGRGLQVMKARNTGEAKWAKKMARDNNDIKKKQQHLTRVAIKVHNSQKHFRDPLCEWFGLWFGGTSLTCGLIVQ
jgi:pre-60S factor REI1